MSDRQVSQQTHQPLSLFDHFFNDSLFREPFWPERMRKMSHMKTDISETETELKITCDVPGLSKQDLKIEVDDEHRMLTISGESKSEKKEDNERFHMVERSSGSFTRSFRLPAYVSTDVKAKLEDGILKLTLPKTEKVQPKKVVQLE